MIAIIEELKNFEFKEKIYASKEDSIVFPTEPILRIEETILETQLIETLLLNILNFQSLIATKAVRTRTATEGKTIIEFAWPRSAIRRNLCQSHCRNRWNRLYQ